MDMY